jgi:hypothetical protein
LLFAERTLNLEDSVGFEPTGHFQSLQFSRLPI